MRIGFVVNQIETEQAVYTTTRLAAAAQRMGHETWTFGVGDFIYDQDGSIHALARQAPKKKYRSLEAYLTDVQESEAERITVDDLDVLLLRNDPAEDAMERAWAQTSGILFGQLAARRGVIVLNDPTHLASAINKAYFQQFPQQARPRTCISRAPAEIKAFIDEHRGAVVIKPLQGSGGKNVFLIRLEDDANVNQIIDAVTRDGYAIVQEYLGAVAEGDIRMFVMNGRPLMHEGKYAAFRRVSTNEDLRSNMHSGGKAKPVKIGPTELNLVEIVRPKLIADGMYLVGLDIVGDKLMEINLFSPGGLGSVLELTDVDFAEVIIRDLQRKLQYREYYGGDVSNLEMATL